MNMNTNDVTHELVSWLREQLKSVNQTKEELERTHNYGKATLCEGMREAYTKCLQRLEAA
ncbi:MAG TPA: hypothetical protein VNZ45_09845 [Bacteroidia bacterium]|jgi:hypothetical protein|nr:hypothetical protein [Bacteroidia bacterium]